MCQIVQCNKKFALILCPLLAKEFLVPLNVASRGIPWQLRNGLVAPEICCPSPSAILEAELWGSLALITTIQLKFARDIDSLFDTPFCDWFASNHSSLSWSPAVVLLTHPVVQLMLLEKQNEQPYQQLFVLFFLEVVEDKGAT